MLFFPPTAHAHRSDEKVESVVFAVMATCRSWASRLSSFRVSVSATAASQKQPPQDDGDGATVSFRMVVSVIPMKTNKTFRSAGRSAVLRRPSARASCSALASCSRPLLSRSEQHRTHVGVIETSGTVLDDGFPEWWKAPFDSVGGVVSTEVVTQSSKPLLQMFT